MTSKLRKKVNNKNQCHHINRMNIHPSIVIGGASIGRCQNEALPGMTLCCEHADKEAMAYRIKDFARQILELGGKLP